MSSSAAPGTIVLGTALAAITVSSWVAVLRTPSMPMMMMSPSLADGASFVLDWGIMMAAMMVPSAAPMILLYRTVSRRLSADGDRVVPVVLFAATYLVIWTLLGIPVYGGYVAAGSLAMCCSWFNHAAPYAVALVLVAAGVYQLTEAKRACLAHCESPLSFLMHRWKSGYDATLRLAAAHAVYCLGCCWALMLILVAAGAMGIWWVAAISLIVFAEKVLPHGWRTARWVGGILIGLGLVVAVRPEFAMVLRHP